MLKTRDRSGWNEGIFIDNAAKIYAVHQKQPVATMEVRYVLCDKPKWTCRLTMPVSSSNKHKSDDTKKKGAGQLECKLNWQNGTGAMPPLEYIAT